MIALHSIKAERINENEKIITESPKFENIKVNLPEYNLPTSSVGFRLVFRFDDAEQGARAFRDKIGAENYSQLGFEVFSISSLDVQLLLSKLMTRNDAMDLLGNISHPCNKLAEMCILSVEGMLAKDLKTHSAAMTGSFLDADKIFTPFREYVLEASRIDPYSIIARLFHLAQSSGTGKTMLCLYLIEQLKNGIYFVYRKAGSTGFPPANDWTILLISRFQTSSSDVHAVKICLAFILAALNSVIQVKQHSSDVNLRTLYVKSCAEFSHIFQSQLAKIESKSDVDLIKDICAIDDTLLGDCFPIIIDECDEFLCLPNNNPQHRISLYRAFRRALAKISSTRIVAVFLGTKSSLNDFVLKYYLDKSARPEPEIKLINPYIFVHSFDVFLTGDVQISHEALVENQIMRPESLQKTVIKCGRPLWNLYDSYDKALKAAAIKLKADKKIAMLSAFVMRTGAPVVPSCQLAHRLVLSGMAALEWVDVEGESCFVSYCPEPVLSNAARLFAGSLDNLNLVLAEFLEYVDKRYVLDSGSAGEFVARVIALRAVDRASEVKLTQTQSTICGSVDETWLKNENTYTDSEFPGHTQKYPSYALITLRDFLTNLANLSDEVVDKLNLSVEMLDGLVNVSQFIAAKRPFQCDQLTLMHAFIGVLVSVCLLVQRALI